MIVTKYDVYALAPCGKEQELADTYNNGDTLEVGRLCSERIASSVKYRIDGEKILRDNYRAEFLAEACQGTDA